MSKADITDDSHLPANPARCPAIRLQSSMNFSTSIGSNLRGLRPGPIFTAGRYGFRFPDACCTTHEMLTPSFRATSAALMSCRIGFTSAMAVGKVFACSIPFTRCMLASHTLVVPSCFLFTEEAELCQTDAQVPAGRPGRYETERRRKPAEQSSVMYPICALGCRRTRIAKLPSKSLQFPPPLLGHQGFQ